MAQRLSASRLGALALIAAVHCGSGDPRLGAASAGPIPSGPPVLEHHGGPRRDGVFVDATLSRASAASFHRDPSFQAALDGAIYAQPLFLADGPGGRPIVLAATEENEVAALDAETGAAIWTRRLGSPVPRSALPCGNIDPVGITGTPIIDPAARTLYLAAMVTPDGGATKQHLAFALSVDDGSTRPGWPVDVGGSARSGSTSFHAEVQNQRGALALVAGVLYIPYGGHNGDCGDYHGWLVGIPASSPSSVTAWATAARAGGIWAPSGVSSDGTELFVATGNTFGATVWSGGEALLRFTAGAPLDAPADFFAPANWPDLDAADADIGGTGPLLVDLPGSTPSQLLVGLGKDGNAYLADRARLGGVGGEIAVADVSTTPIITAAATYATALGTYVVFHGAGAHCPPGEGGDLTALRLVPGAPPRVETAWCARANGAGSPMVTTTDGHAEAIVWAVGAEGDGRLHGFDADTGQVVYGGGGPSDALGTVRRFQAPILGGGRVFVAVDGGVVVFRR
jgi:hypothetical protein